ncbi:cytochrome P450 [Suillus cothurnatus]|nr:cytochrome P450 [Suillus cothurnatus]
MPCLDDGASLPYLDAILHNVLRWYPLAPLELHMLTSSNHDDVYGGYSISKGVIVIVNQWFVTVESVYYEDMFPDASHFDPNHHLTVDRKLKDLFVNHFAFGHGRHICPENNLWIAAFAILTVLCIDHAKDSNRDRIEVKPEFSTSL